MAKPDPAHDLDVAARAMAAGDAAHALQHLSGAFAAAPFDEHLHALLEKVAHQTDVLTHLPDNGFLGTLLLRAWALRRSGRIDEAVTLMAQVTEFQSDRGFEALLASWLIALHASGGTLGEEASTQVARLLARIGEGTIGLNRLRPGEQALLSGYGELASALLACTSTPIAGPMAMGLLRRTRRYEEALAVALPAEGPPREFVLTQRGLTLRAMGENARAVEAFAAAAKLDPQHGNLIFEQARCWFVAGEFDRALGILTPDRVGSDDAEATRLLQLTRERPSGDRLELLDEIRRAATGPSLELPADATANIFREPHEGFVPGATKLRTGVSGWESPSNRLLISLYSSGSFDVTAASYTMSVPALDFDPWGSRRPLAPPLWMRQSDGVVVQGVAPGSPEIRTAIGKLARTAAGFDSLWGGAVALAARWSAAEAPDIASAMVHPPTDAEWIAALPKVLYRHQIAAACVLANLPGAWEVTFPLLESLIFGPVDWVGAAAVVALTELASRDPERAAPIRALLSAAVSDLVPHSTEPRFFPLARALRLLPGTSSEARDKLKTWYGKYLGEDEASPPAKERPAEAPAAPLSPDPVASPPVPGPGLVAKKGTSSAWIAAAIAVGCLLLFALLRAAE